MKGKEYTCVGLDKNGKPIMKLVEKKFVPIHKGLFSTVPALPWKKK